MVQDEQKRYKVPDSCLVSGVSGVPQGVAQILPRSCAGVDQLDRDARRAESFGWLFLPVGLRHLLSWKERKTERKKEPRG